MFSECCTAIILAYIFAYVKPVYGCLYRRYVVFVRMISLAWQILHRYYPTNITLVPKIKIQPWHQLRNLIYWRQCTSAYIKIDHPLNRACFCSALFYFLLFLDFLLRWDLVYIDRVLLLLSIAILPSNYSHFIFIC